jgi:hypothetical protein
MFLKQALPLLKISAPKILLRISAPKIGLTLDPSTVPATAAAKLGTA